jgi:hypothetical protein
MRLRKVELYLHSPIRLRGVVINGLRLPDGNACLVERRYSGRASGRPSLGASQYPESAGTECAVADPWKETELPGPQSE